LLALVMLGNGSLDGQWREERAVCVPREIEGDILETTQSMDLL